jgi:SAM-dependent methyltransferase
MKELLKKLIPLRVRLWLRYPQKVVKYWGSHRFCPVCSRFSSKFERVGFVPREDAQCVWCGALERHRFVWLFLQRKTDLFTTTTGKSLGKVLHVAPELCFQQKLRQMLGSGYVTADLEHERVDVKMDITDIGYPDETFDVILCSHVLEHVPDDRKAMREFCRVLKKSGWAILLVPITVEKTIEDPTITDPKERLRLFGQEDHVRRYGADYVERLKAAGFKVDCIKPADFLSPEEIERMGITKGAGEIYFCRKNSPDMLLEQGRAKTRTFN